MLTNYVKFRRGSLEVFNQLKAMNKIEQDTLYFIYGESENTADLYLGSKLISSGENDLGNLSIKLGDLIDTSVEEPMASDVLVYNEQTGLWENRSIEVLLEGYIPDVSTTVDDVSIEESVDGKLQIKDFGTGYYAYVPPEKDDEGNIITPSTYEYVNGFKGGLELRVVRLANNELTLGWYEPGSETVEDIVANLEELSNSIGSLDWVVRGEGGLTDKVAWILRDVEDIETSLSTKADSDSVYTKTEIDESLANIYTKAETDTAIGEAVAAAGHLKRKKLNSEETIDVTAEDADQYIYMIPTGLQEEDDKYDEYMVIDGVVEKVGSWEVNLNEYATTEYVNDELAKKVDAKTGERLITDSEAAKLESIEDGAQKNYIISVDENNFSVVDGNLNLVSVAKTQVEGLNELFTNVTNLSDVLNGDSGLISKVSSLSSEVENFADTYVTKETFNSTVEDLNALINTNKNDIKSLSEKIDTLDYHLTWQGLE